MKDLTAASNNRQAIALIKYAYDRGHISREEARLLAQPVLDRINIQTTEIAKRHSRKPYKVDFVNAMRNSY